MKRFAFIDVQNTETTALKVLKFVIDNERLFNYLKGEKWKCEQVFFYPGIQFTDEERIEQFKELEKIGAIVRPKMYNIYKTPDKIISNKCPECGTEISDKVDMGYNWKCNCDVELTVDMLECAGPDTELLLFTGDGDFEFLIKKVLEKGAKVAIISSARKQKKGFTYSTSRLAIKLRILTEQFSDSVRFLEMDNIKFQINKIT